MLYRVGDRNVISGRSIRIMVGRTMTEKSNCLESFKEGDTLFCRRTGRVCVGFPVKGIVEGPYDACPTDLDDFIRRHYS